ncbi:hypothetical protein A9404_11240 [Halothiobacillus diazotrophicus]|uniref:PLD phosphodiesterase domain-containing protein n=1 Tax=Halothiobacillus diazotrophicus TaxID=1860122 RepID=A0A191ZKL5_9GAMM|nr:hypothetical protein A9404_11240 [Halothiobacillus diazotrophicus]
MSQAAPFWHRDRAEQVSFLIDGEAYYSAFADLLLQARNQAWIICWDVDSRMALTRPCTKRSSPCRLVDVVCRALSDNPNLHIHLLAWDYSMIYALEREWRPLFSQSVYRHPRLHVHFDSHHPLGASQHQKALIVDDRTALVGGFDPSKWRWDSSEHAPDDERRRDPQGDRYPPFHDVALLVSGQPASRLGKLARQRWALATGEHVPPVNRTDERNAVTTPWPKDVPVLLRDADIGIARTLPAHGEQSEAREVEAVLLDAVKQASGFIYIENQYFTSHRIGQALIDRLGEPDGPELVIVLPREKDGWLERVTMDVLRARLIRRLQAADAFDRLRIYYPEVRGLAPQMISVHSKLVIADNIHLNVGSANLSNRSMGLDSELNLSLLGSDEAGRQAIDQIRRRLLAEHLGTTEAQVAAAESTHGSLIASIEALNRADAPGLELDQSEDSRTDPDRRRWLEPLTITLDEDLERQVPDAAVIDPERPMPPDELIDLFIEHEHRKPMGKRALGLAVLIASIAGLALAWRVTPLSEWLSPDRLSHHFQALRTEPLGGVLALLLFVGAAVAGMPITPLVIVSALLFGAWAGFGIAYAGAVSAAVLGFFLGRLLGRKTIRRLAGARLDNISRRMARKGILTVFSFRLLPIAPFALINVVAGASHLRFRDFVIGSLAGLAPGTFALTVFSDRLLTAFLHPSLGSIAVLLLVSLIFIAIGWGLSHWLSLRSQASGS